MRFADLIADALEAGRDRLNRADTLRRLNDSFRRTFADGHVVPTRGVMLLDPTDWRTLFRAVRDFDSFNAEDDPYGEHDFGALAFKGVRYFWKIDYYDLDLRNASPDPTDPAFTMRVMTIMRADEY
ncbi:DUF3768 domain-containing protein [Shinella kummerowiae]|uniref:DUF3768 domain-containing protein n=1 Tax=Shinella kummerowiae TaxID=417745 RepID=UPI0021B626D7|nr:DUF3768 domain-containing protein [Shinella kummerowiae]MCT7663533.1 DUF3768 domain-containing protein [Shinella kummerowiae]